MTIGLRVALVAACAIALAAPAQGRAPVPESNANRARDGDIAIQEELCAARKAGTIAAYDLFIARHRGHPLVETARAERERLISSRP
ncbi:hypothetical protein ACFQRC_06065 [Enterovirga sp. GCM10030262]|uniref:hypothetical protein n=1 Tax=Enterovirga sp. GCM10030262 TaxID=3273391 RepID=UPI003611BCE2